MCDTHTHLHAKFDSFVGPRLSGQGDDRMRLEHDEPQNENSIQTLYFYFHNSYVWRKRKIVAFPIFKLSRPTFTIALLLLSDLCSQAAFQLR